MNASKVMRFEDQLCFSLYSSSLMITQRYKPLIGRLNMTYPQYLVLLILWEKDGINLKTICDRLGQKPGALTPVIQRLEMAGYLARNQSSDDERSIVITLTPNGIALESAAKAINKEVFKDLSDSDKDVLLSKLKAFRDLSF